MHPSAGIEAQARRREHCRRALAVDPAFHYVSARQAELWLEVHRAHSPAHGDTAVRETYADFFRAQAPALGGCPHVVALGSGGGAKDRLLLKALAGSGHAPARFTPQDVSPGLAMLSAEAVQDLDLVHPVQPVVGDLLAMNDFGDWLDRLDGGAARLFTAFGLVPNFEPGEFFPWLARLLRPRDALLLSANLLPAEAEPDGLNAGMEKILPQYDNPETRAWLTRVLHDWGWEADVDLDGYRMQIAADQEQHRFEATVPWRAGGKLRLFFSHRYTPQTLAAALEAHGLLLGEGSVAPGGEEGLWLVRRPDPGK
ncbi:MAG: L-histidine N(alpha)-methyltransferase [Verrucomicrobiota bacterium]